MTASHVQTETQTTPITMDRPHRPDTRRVSIGDIPELVALARVTTTGPRPAYTSPELIIAALLSGAGRLPPAADDPGAITGDLLTVLVNQDAARQPVGILRGAQVLNAVSDFLTGGLTVPVGLLTDTLRRLTEKDHLAVDDVPADLLDDSTRFAVYTLNLPAHSHSLKA